MSGNPSIKKQSLPSKKGASTKKSTPVKAKTPLSKKLVISPPIRRYFVSPHASPIGMNPMPDKMRFDRVPGRLTEGPKGVGLSKCALLYAKALTNPFGQFEDLPCVPVAPPVPTYRFRAINRTVFVVPANGTGFVCVTLSPSNSANTIFTSTSSYAGSVFAKTGVGVGAAPRANLPFGIFDGIQGRIVGFGLRIRCIAQALYVGGAAYGVQSAEAEDLTTWTQTQVVTDPRTIQVPIALQDQSEWQTLIYRPNDELDLDMKGEDVAFPSVPTIGWLVIGTTVNLQYQVEIVEFWEFMGQSASTGAKPPELTNSHADPVGLSRVLEGTQTAPLSGKMDDWIAHTADSIVEAMAHSDTVSKTIEDLLGIAGVSMPAVATMVKSLTGFLAL